MFKIKWPVFGRGFDAIVAFLATFAVLYGCIIGILVASSQNGKLFAASVTIAAALVLLTIVYRSHNREREDSRMLADKSERYTALLSILGIKDGADVEAAVREISRLAVDHPRVARQSAQRLQDVDKCRQALEEIGYLVGSTTGSVVPSQVRSALHERKEAAQYLALNLLNAARMLRRAGTTQAEKDLAAQLRLGLLDSLLSKPEHLELLGWGKGRSFQHQAEVFALQPDAFTGVRWENYALGSPAIQAIKAFAEG